MCPPSAAISVPPPMMMAGADEEASNNSSGGGYGFQDCGDGGREWGSELPDLENWGEGSTPLEDDTQLAYDWPLLLPAAAGFGTSPAAASVSAAAAGATGTAATNLGDDKGFCQLWLALARRELQLPAAWAAQISEGWDQASTDLKVVTEPKPFGNSHYTVVRCRRRYDPKDRVDLLPRAKHYYGRYIFHASKLLLLLRRNQCGEQGVRRKGCHDPLKNSYYEKNYDSNVLFKNHLEKAFKGFLDRTDNQNSKSSLWAEWKLTEAGVALSPLSPDQLATLQSILSDLHVDQFIATTNLATATVTSEPESEAQAVPSEATAASTLNMEAINHGGESTTAAGSANTTGASAGTEKKRPHDATLALDDDGDPDDNGEGAGRSAFMRTDSVTANQLIILHWPMSRRHPGITGAERTLCTYF